MKTVFVVAAAGLAGAAIAGPVNVTDNTSGGAVVDGVIGANEYSITIAGNGASGFGGPVGGATLHLDADDNGIYFGLSNLGDISGNSIRVYFGSDAFAGGFTELSSAAGFNEQADFGRAQISRPAGDGVILPFAADFGWLISPAFGGFQALFDLETGGDNSLIFAGNGVNATPVGENPSNAVFEAFIPFADLGILRGDDLQLTVLYANNNSGAPEGAFLSNEGFPGQGFADNPGGNSGGSPLTLPNFIEFNTIPTPGAAAMLGLAGLAATRRRR